MAFVVPPVTRVDNVTLEKVAGVLSVKDTSVTPVKASAALRRRAMSFGTGPVAAAGTAYVAPGDGMALQPATVPLSATQDPNASWVAPRAGNLLNLRVRAAGPLTAGNSVTLTVMKNGVATSLELVLDENTAAGPLTVSDSDSTSVTSGDRISVRHTKVGASGVNTAFNGYLEFEPT